MLEPGLFLKLEGKAGSEGTTWASPYDHTQGWPPCSNEGPAYLMPASQGSKVT